MKLTTILLLIATLQVFSKSVYSQDAELTLNLGETSVGQVLSEIENQSEFYFLFNQKLVDTERKVNIDLSDKKIVDVLDQVFSETNIDYVVMDRQIVLSPKEYLADVKNVIQPRTITGTVRDQDGEPLLGTTISIRGTTIGTISDAEGNYTLSEVPDDAILVFSYIGMSSQEIAVGSQTIIDVQLTSDITGLEEVVVTALGISRDKKSIGYAVQELDGRELAKAREPNLVNALSGKIAGVQVVNGNGTIGASSNILIRGSTSISGKNQPLFVVDGVPINNETNHTSWYNFTGPTNFNSDGYDGHQQVDYGNAGAEINPDDIESMSVLKGANAAALYGSRAANGVILITTKSGKNSKGIGVTFSSNITFESPLKTPEYQTEYGLGSSGQYEYVDGLGGGTNDNGANWGPKLDGQMIQQYVPSDPNNPQSMPWVSRLGSDPVGDFLETGMTMNHNLSIVGGFDKGHFRLSYTNFNQKGMVPNTALKRNSITLRSGYNITEKLEVEASVNYIPSSSNNRPNVGTKTRSNLMESIAYLGQNADLNALKENNWEPQQTGIKQAVYSRATNNPYFYAWESENGNRKDRMIGYVNLSYEILPNLKARVRTGKDFFSDYRTEEKAWSTVGYPFGNYRISDIFFVENNTDFLLDYNNSTDNWDFNVNFGGNSMNQKTNILKSGASGLVAPGIFNLGNYKDAYSTSNYIIEKSINSLYGMFSIGYKNYLYLDITGRNDWSSALPVSNNSYFYPSASASAIITEMLTLPKWVTFLKLRGSVAQVGNDTDPYNTTTIQYQYGQGWLDEYAVASVKPTLGAPGLKPEIITAYEFGLDARFFGNRVGIDFSAYKGNSINQILPISMAAESGYQLKYVNAGELENQGMELMVNLVPVRTQNFSWDIDVNFARNSTTVVKLTEELDRFHLVERWINIDAVEGERLGTFYGDYILRFDPETNKLGQEGLIVHRSSGKIEESDDGAPLDPSDVKAYLGNVYPDWTGGIMNTLSYKNFSLGFLIDIRQGGELYSRTYIDGNRRGALIESVELFGRDHYDNPDKPDVPYMIGEGVAIAPGKSWRDAIIDENNVLTNAEEMFVTNDNPYAVQSYIGSYFDNDAEGTFDASYIKLREVKLDFRIPASLTRKLPIASATISIIGRNLAVWDHVPHIDPETSSYSGRAPGAEMWSYPSARSIGYNLTIRF